jgi:single-strand DNA-binding protein
MASFNQLILLGNLTRDPEMRYLPSNTPVVEFGLACNRRYKDAQGQDKEEAMFIDCAAFGKQAEIINQYCHKGDLLFIQGRLKLDTWEDKQGGGKRSKHRAVIENFQLMPRREGGGGGGGNYGGEGAEGAPAPQQRRPMPARPAAGRPAPAPQQQAPAPAPAEPPYDEGPQQFKEDDIPF